MRIFINKESRYAYAVYMHERITTALKKGTSWEVIMDGIKCSMSTYTSMHTDRVLKDDMLALNAFMYGAPYATYEFSRLGRYLKVMPNKHAILNFERHDITEASDLLELLCGRRTPFFKKACLSWVDAVHAIAPDARIGKYYAAYTRVLRWLSTGKGARPTTWDVDTTYKILTSW